KPHALPPSVRSTVPRFPARFCCSLHRGTSPVSAHPVRLRRWHAGWPSPSLHRCQKPPGVRARSSGPGSFASAATSPHSPPPGSPYPAPACAACTLLPPAGTNPSASRNCAAVESTRNRLDQSFCPVPAPAPAAGYPPAAPATPALLTPRAEQSNKSPCSPSPPTRPSALLATLPCPATPTSSLQSWLFLAPSHPASERTPSAVRCLDQFQQCS